MDKVKILERKLLQLFPDETLRKEVLELIYSYGNESHHLEPDRVQLAILKASGENPTIEQIQSNTSLAKSDYRDLLAYTEYPREFEKWSMPEGPEKDAIRAADRKEYEDWLKS